MNVEKNKYKENLNLYDRRDIRKGYGPKTRYSLTFITNNGEGGPKCSVPIRYLFETLSVFKGASINLCKQTGVDGVFKAATARNYESAEELR